MTHPSYKALEEARRKVHELNEQNRQQEAQEASCFAIMLHDPISGTRRVYGPYDDFEECQRDANDFATELNVGAGVGEPPFECAPVILFPKFGTLKEPS